MRYLTGIAALSFLLNIASPPRARAVEPSTYDQLDLSVTSSALTRAVLVHSYSLSFLYDQITGSRIYDQELILGHQVSDEGNIIFNCQIVSPIGYASCTTGLDGDLAGQFDHCYAARMASHVNAYNLHRTLVSDLVCAPPDPHPETPPKDNCPVLLDLARNGFHLSGPAPAVHFDIDADGIPDSIAWTKAGEDDAFLCWDRNHNGVIDDGKELFGYATRLRSGRPAKIGYRALAELDERERGGNQDGIVDARDQLFPELCAWVDRNRNGVSEPGEILSLDQVGVSALAYDFTTLHLFDDFGNLFRYSSRVEMKSPTGGVTWWLTYDVLFAEAP